MFICQGFYSDDEIAAFRLQHAENVRAAMALAKASGREPHPRIVALREQLAGVAQAVDAAGLNPVSLNENAGSTPAARTKPA